LAAIEVKVPDIGNFRDIPVIEVLVKPGDSVKKDESLVTLESDKATMEVPAPQAGTVKEVRVKVGDKVSEGSSIVLLEGPAEGAKTAPPERSAATARPTPPERPALAAVPPPAASAPKTTAALLRPAPAAAKRAEPASAPAAAPTNAPPTLAAVPTGTSRDRETAVDAPEHGAPPAHASPGVRRFARELGVQVVLVHGSGPKGRILKEDVQGFVKQSLAARATPAAGSAAPAASGFAELGLPAWPKVDFAKFGPIERQPRSRIQKISGPALARNWVMIPHVTQFDEADVTELEAFRARLNEENAKSGVKVTPLAFLIKAVVAALRKYPTLNSSLDGDDLVVKQYWNIGFAADTPQGLVVPVVREADRKGVMDIARESAELAAKARDGKLSPTDMQGGTFSISSLGGIGGTAFTPIINAPEVAILGVAKSATKPVWNGHEFAPRTMLPLCLSYDHRVVDGALAARFTTYLAQVLSDLRRATL
jgi:pyruvate dehydrogenase E2 component (dihydrolipoamide acetyltransferase)